METKKTLRRRLKAADDRIAELRREAETHLAAAVKLDNIGYEPIETENDIFGDTDIRWHLTEAQSAKVAARDAELAEHLAKQIADARDEGRREALALVIEGLEIPGYKTGYLSVQRDVEKFHADLTIAVQVRRDIAAATERGRVEKKIAGLLKKESANWGHARHVFTDIGVDLAGDSGYVHGAVGPARLKPSAFAAAAAAVTEAAAAAELAKSTTVDHDVSTAGEKLEDTAAA